MEDGMERKETKIEKIVKSLAKKDTQVNFRINSKLKELFVKTCEEEGITPSDCFNQLVLEYLERKGKL
jgi:antitoxin component of RelBE/YafQ-DinJ toxin-antitoxin module